MRLGFKYEDTGDGPPVVEVFNAETGEAIEHVVAITFAMNANDMMPLLHISCHPATANINGEVQTAPAADHRGQPTFPTRERVVDLDSDHNNDQG